MVARHKYRNDDGDLEEVSTVLRWGYTLAENAEEGSAGQCTVVVDDPDMSLDFVAWRRWIVYEDESEDDNQIIFSGFVGAQNVAHTGGDITQPVGRVWTLELVDMNALFGMRLMVGEDTDRPEETDVERITWVAESEEMGYFDDLTLLLSGDPVDMDARDVRGQSTAAIFDECAQQSEVPKNYWIGATGTIGEVGADNFLWYGPDGGEEYTSPLSFSNLRGDLDMAAVDAGTATTYPIGKDTVLRRTGERIYSGAYVEYEDGAVYRKRTATLAQFTLSGRDISVPAPEIKTQAKAIARANATTARLNVQDERIKTSVEIPASKASMLRTGMRVALKAVHEPGYGEFGWMRILNTAPEPIYGGRWYRIGLELQGPASGPVVEDVTLVATNTVLEDSTRNATDESIPITFEAGQVWRWTLTNTQHAPAAFTDAFALVYGGPAVIVRAWGISTYYAGGPPIPGPAPGGQTSPPSPPLDEDTGTFVMAYTGIGTFTIYGGANYGAGTLDVDEQWTCVLERIG